MLNEYYNIILFVTMAFVFSSILLCAVYLVTSKSILDPEKGSTYECGFAPFSEAKYPFEVTFALIAIIYLLFDIEVLYLYPLTIVYYDLHSLQVLWIVIFFVIVNVGIIFEIIHDLIRIDSFSLLNPNKEYNNNLKQPFSPKKIHPLQDTHHMPLKVEASNDVDNNQDSTIKSIGVSSILTSPSEVIEPSSVMIPIVLTIVTAGSCYLLYRLGKYLYNKYTNSKSGTTPKSKSDSDTDADSSSGSASDTGSNTDAGSGSDISNPPTEIIPDNPISNTPTQIIPDNPISNPPTEIIPDNPINIPPTENIPISNPPTEIIPDINIPNNILRDYCITTLQEILNILEPSLSHDALVEIYNSICSITVLLDNIPHLIITDNIDYNVVYNNLQITLQYLLDNSDKFI